MTTDTEPFTSEEELAWHLLSVHCLANALGLDAGELRDAHDHEHSGSGTIRNHSADSLHYDLTKGMAVLAERESADLAVELAQQRTEVEQLRAELAAERKLIGPLTAAEWAEFRQCNDDLLQCCAVTSDFRDEVFYLLRMGGEDRWHRHGLRRAYWNLVDHPLPEGRAGELIARLVAYFLGDPPEPKQPGDDMSTEEILAELKARQEANEPRLCEDTEVHGPHDGCPGLAPDPCPAGDPDCETGDDGSCHDGCTPPASVAEVELLRRRAAGRLDELEAVQALAERAQRNGEPLDPGSILDIVGWPTQAPEAGRG